MTLSQHKNCLLCGSNKLVPLPRYAAASLVKCEQCSFVFAVLVPTTDELIAHYETYPRHDSISPITLKRYKELCDGFLPYRQTGNFLDVGCGNGHLLDVAKKEGWKTFGTEFTDTAVAICRSKGISMQQGVLNADAYPAGSFDVITFIEVLEHINNPHDELRKFHKLLRPGGILYITTPNFNSLTRLTLKERWHAIEYPEHLCYYTARTLNKLLEDENFGKIYLKTTGISPASFRRGMSTGTNGGAVPDDQTLRNLTEGGRSGQLLKTTVNFTLNTTRTGDSLKAFYIKNPGRCAV